MYGAQFRDSKKILPAPPCPASPRPVLNGEKKPAPGQGGAPREEKKFKKKKI